MKGRKNAISGTAAHRLAYLMSPAHSTSTSTSMSMSMSMSTSMSMSHSMSTW